MKQNALLSRKWLEILESPSEWKIASTLFPSEAPLVRDRSHARWRAAHADRHANRELVFALEGSCAMSLEGNIHKMSPGTVFLFDSGEEHDKAYPPWTNDCVHLWFSFVRGTAFPRLLRVHAGKISAVNAQNEPLMPLMEQGHALPRVWSECRRRKDGSEAFLRARVHSAIAGLLLEYAELGFERSNAILTESTAERQAKVVEAIKEHIRETGGAGVSLDRLAVISGYSKYHFLRMFKEHSGTTVHEYVNQCRMAKCRSLLAAGLRKSEIADILGFSSPATFSRWLHSERKRRYAD